jgi:hypothetical protein
MTDDLAPTVNIISFAEARERAGISEGRLFHLVRRGVLIKQGDGLNADHFLAAVARQEEIRANPNPCWTFGGSNILHGRDAATRMLLAFGPGFLDVLVVDVSAERLPGVDYDSAIERAIEDAIHASQNDQLRLRIAGAAKAVEAVIWARFGDPAAMRLEAIRTVANAILAGWARLSLWRSPPDWRSDADDRQQVIGFYPSPRQALEVALPLTGPELGRWEIHLGDRRLLNANESRRISSILQFWADRVPGFDPRRDGVANGLKGATIDLFDKAMNEIKALAGPQLWDFFADADAGSIDRMIRSTVKHDVDLPLPA